MKTTVSLFLVLSFATASSAFAQQSQRLVSTRVDLFTNGTFAPSDSAYFTYSGGRGGGGHQGEYESAIPYDAVRHMSKNVTAFWQDTLQTSKTYDNTDRLLTQVDQYYDGQQWQNIDKFAESWGSSQLYPDSETDYIWQNNEWVPDFRSLHAFDDFGNDTFDNDQIWDTVGQQWLTTFQITDRYNAMDLLTFEQVFYMSNGSITSGSKRFYYYDSRGYIVFDSIEEWFNGVWQSYGRSRRWNDAKGNPLSISTDIWWPVGTAYAWVKHDTDTYTYTSAGGVISMESDWWKTPLILQRGSLTEYVSFPDTLQFEQIYISGDTVTNTWDTQYRYIGRSGINGLLVKYLDIYNAGNWVHDWRDTEGYDTAGNDIFSKVESWDTVFSGWYGNSFQTALFNNSHQYKSQETYTWGSNAWVPSTLTNYWYESYNGSSVKPERIPVSTVVYPNPFTKSFTVHFSAEAAGDATLLLYDMTGKLVTRTTSNVFPGENKLTWDAGYTLPSGCYTYKLLVDNTFSTGKVIAN